MRLRMMMRAMSCAAAMAGLLALAGLTAKAQTSTASKSSALSIPESSQIQPVQLQKILQSDGAARPMVLQVGFQMLYQQAHIPGAIYAGPTAQADGLARFEKTVAGLPRNKWIVIYCGCCPWSHCPNMGPAFAKLRSMGFTHVQALHIEHNFGDDWVNQGYRVESGK